ncbi:hypothetical protein BDK51DRAFT_45668 [Blyttiomyces helicus]|uniref:Uncharacterized protein n=1 Tax=Blyttiomyces helicus TaxID=388810 RepID=A0A4P9W4V0_9FUNG|nr:hypothetical protein BDK51DRAFT_45668 [Blyttiomyces helicus]|eukprot:RKO85750.1 hypothetical protein BDK51DRAFT_45668 [Blyttiomyces helicus]
MGGMLGGSLTQNLTASRFLEAEKWTNLLKASGNRAMALQRKVSAGAQDGRVGEGEVEWEKRNILGSSDSRGAISWGVRPRRHNVISPGTKTTVKSLFGCLIFKQAFLARCGGLEHASPVAVWPLTNVALGLSASSSCKEDQPGSPMSFRPCRRSTLKVTAGRGSVPPREFAYFVDPFGGSCGDPDIEVLEGPLRQSPLRRRFDKSYPQGTLPFFLIEALRHVKGVCLSLHLCRANLDDLPLDSLHQIEKLLTFVRNNGNVWEEAPGWFGEIYRKYEDPSTTLNEFMKSLDTFASRARAILNEVILPAFRADFSIEAAISSRDSKLELSRASLKATLAELQARDDELHQLRGTAARYRAQLIKAEAEIGALRTNVGLHAIGSDLSPDVIANAFEGLYASVHSLTQRLVPISAPEHPPLAFLMMCPNTTTSPIKKNHATYAAESMVSEVILDILSTDLLELDQLDAIIAKLEDGESARPDGELQARELSRDKATLASRTWARLHAAVASPSCHPDFRTLIATFAKSYITCLSDLFGKAAPTSGVENIVHAAVLLRLRIGAIGAEPFMPVPAGPGDAYSRHLEKLGIQDARLNEVHAQAAYQGTRRFDEETMATAAPCHGKLNFRFAYFPGLRTGKVVMAKCRVFCE